MVDFDLGLGRCLCCHFARLFIVITIVILFVCVVFIGILFVCLLINCLILLAFDPLLHYEDLLLLLYLGQIPSCSLTRLDLRICIPVLLVPKICLLLLVDLQILLVLLDVLESVLVQILLCFLQILPKF